MQGIFAGTEAGEGEIGFLMITQGMGDRIADRDSFRGTEPTEILFPVHPLSEALPITEGFREGSPAFRPLTVRLRKQGLGCAATKVCVQSLINAVEISQVNTLTGLGGQVHRKQNVGGMGGIACVVHTPEDDADKILCLVGDFVIQCQTAPVCGSVFGGDGVPGSCRVLPDRNR